MIEAILDTTVVLHLFRKYEPALNWFDNPGTYGVTTVTWLEVMQGAKSKQHQSQSLELLENFELIHLTSIDQGWAMMNLVQRQFTHHIPMNDCLIASVAHRMRLPLFTHNLKDMTPLIGDLARKPYL